MDRQDFKQVAFILGQYEANQQLIEAFVEHLKGQPGFNAEAFIKTVHSTRNRFKGADV